eukprot:746239-Hanusia_phi.AAC.16
MRVGPMFGCQGVQGVSLFFESSEDGWIITQTGWKNGGKVGRGREVERREGGVGLAGASLTV